MKIIDTFTFYNELDMLFFRLTELNKHVDYFVICESTFTHSGNKKPLYYLENKERFKEFKGKIVHVVVDDMPNTGNAWDNERYQRKCIHLGIEHLSLRDDDLIIVGDCDEIPDIPSVLKHLPLNDVHCLCMHMYYYNLKTFVSDWSSAKILPYKIYKSKNDPELIRQMQTDRQIKPGGWHFSYFGDKHFIENKLKNFAHQEYNKINIIQNIDNKMNKKSCLFSNKTFKHIEIDTNAYLPVYYKLLLK
uniref:Glycosyltransferase n=1 Tax=viral metagenome TaxID=1070528 RepID=A0A6C0BQS3_9ZZZZ